MTKAIEHFPWQIRPMKAAMLKKYSPTRSKLNERYLKSFAKIAQKYVSYILYSCLTMLYWIRYLCSGIFNILFSSRVNQNPTWLVCCRKNCPVCCAQHPSSCSDYRYSLLYNMFVICDLCQCEISSGKDIFMINMQERKSIQI